MARIRKAANFKTRLSVYGNETSSQQLVNLIDLRTAILMHISFLLTDLKAGGVQKRTLDLATSMMNLQHKVDIVICEPNGPLQHFIPKEANRVFLKISDNWQSKIMVLKADPFGVFQQLFPILLTKNPLAPIQYLPALTQYLQQTKPDCLISGKPLSSIVAVFAHQLAKVPTKLIVSIRNNMSIGYFQSKSLRKRFLLTLFRRVFPKADAIVAVSNGVAQDFAKQTGISPLRIQTIYNPVVGPYFHKKKDEPLEHPWLQSQDIPVILSVGRLTAQKDYVTLIKAFSLVRKESIVRLMILGEERKVKYKSELQELARELKIDADILLPGFVSNPYPYMANASVFVLSSRYEGLPGVLIEALACGCPIVSTDCPSGPSEILNDGEFGELVPVGDAQTMSQAILRTLKAPLDRQKLVNRGSQFSYDAAAKSYIKLMESQKLMSERK